MIWPTYLEPIVRKFIANDPVDCPKTLADGYLAIEQNTTSLLEIRQHTSLLLDACWEGCARDIKKIDSIRTSLQFYPVICCKRDLPLEISEQCMLPSLEESVSATCVRLEVVHQVRQQLSHVGPVGILVAGSLGYGKFFSVSDQSDIDLVLIYDDKKIQFPDWYRHVPLENASHIVKGQELAFQQAFEVFRELYQDGQADTLLYKFRLPSDLELSLSVVPSTTFIEHLRFPNEQYGPLEYLSSAATKEYRVFQVGDINETVTNMLQRTWPITIVETKVKGGWISSYPGSRICGYGCFVPGEFASFFAPFTDLWVANQPQNTAFKRYGDFVLEEERQKASIQSDASLLYTHRRYLKIAPYAVLRWTHRLPLLSLDQD